MTPQERAVIRAARIVSEAGVSDFETMTHALSGLFDAVATLDGITLPWHEVAEGDSIRSVKNGNFYEVTGVVALVGGARRLAISTGATITRPTEAEPNAVVRRGATGRAVDVLTSGLEAS